MLSYALKNAIDLGAAKQPRHFILHKHYVDEYSPFNLSLQIDFKNIYWLVDYVLN